MRYLILVILFLVSTQYVHAECTLDLKTMKKTSTSYYLANGARLNERTVMKLSSVCKINIEIVGLKAITKIRSK